MSAKPKEAVERECPVCGYTGQDAHSYHSYCSKECADRHKGRKLLSLLESDHRFCSSCATKLKDLTKARPSDPDCFIGFQHLSGDAQKGEKHVRLPALKGEKERIIDSHGTVCGNCGSTSHSDTWVRDEQLLDDEADTVAERLFEALVIMREEGQHEHEFDLGSFVEVWNESPGEWAKALGASLINE